MENLVVDVNAIIIPNNIKPLYPPNGQNGAVFRLSKNEIKLLHESENPLEIFKEDEFIKGIKGRCYFYYDSKKKLLEISDTCEFYPELIKTIKENLPSDTKIRLYIDSGKVGDVVPQLEGLGFNQVYKSSYMDIPEIEFPKKKICVSMEGKDDEDQLDLVLLTEFALSQPKKGCYINVKIDEKSLKKLQGMTESGYTKNKNGEVTQKEMAGTLRIDRLEKQKIDGEDVIIHVLTVDDNTINMGKEETVSISEGVYNYHTHPVSAYVKNDIKIGWPSLQDYKGFLSSIEHFDTIFHMVVAVEGVYILSIDAEKVKGLDYEGIIKILEDNCDVPYGGEVVELEDYYKKIRRQDIFLVELVPWDKAGDMFKVNFSDENKCVTNS